MFGIVSEPETAVNPVCIILLSKKSKQQDSVKHRLDIRCGCIEGFR